MIPKQNYGDSMKTWEDYNQEREEYFIDKLGPELWDALGDECESRLRYDPICEKCGDCLTTEEIQMANMVKDRLCEACRE